MTLNDNQKKLIIVVLAVGLMALSTSASNIFSINVFGQPPLNNSVILIAGNNTTLTQDTLNSTITISTLGGGINQSDNTKVNKSGDAMIGYLTLQNNSAGLSFKNESTVIGSMYQVDYMPNYLIDAFVMNLNRQVINGVFSCDSSYCDAPGGSLQIVSDKWNNDTYFAYYGFAPNQTGYTRAFALGKNGLTVDTLSGSGNAYACLDSTGKLYRGNPTC